MQKLCRSKTPPLLCHSPYFPLLALSTHIVYRTVLSIFSTSGSLKVRLLSGFIPIFTRLMQQVTVYAAAKYFFFTCYSDRRALFTRNAVFFCLSKIYNEYNKKSVCINYSRYNNKQRRRGQYSVKEVRKMEDST